MDSMVCCGGKWSFLLSSRFFLFSLNSISGWICCCTMCCIVWRERICCCGGYRAKIENPGKYLATLALAWLMKLYYLGRKFQISGRERKCELDEWRMRFEIQIGKIFIVLLEFTIAHSTLADDVDAQHNIKNYRMMTIKAKHPASNLNLCAMRDARWEIGGRMW